MCEQVTRADHWQRSDELLLSQSRNEVVAVSTVDSSQQRPAGKPPQDKLPDTVVQLAGYFIKRLFDLISEVAGDTKKAIHAAIMLACFSFPIGAVFFYLHLNPQRWRWVLISSGGTIISATVARISKNAIRGIKSRRAKKVSRSETPKTLQSGPVASQTSDGGISAESGENTQG
jgi:hypothetical protein